MPCVRRRPALRSKRVGCRPEFQARVMRPHHRDLIHHEHLNSVPPDAGVQFALHVAELFGCTWGEFREGSGKVRTALDSTRGGGVWGGGGETICSSGKAQGRLKEGSGKAQGRLREGSGKAQRPSAVQGRLREGSCYKLTCKSAALEPLGVTVGDVAPIACRHLKRTVISRIVSASPPTMFNSEGGGGEISSMVLAPCPMSHSTPGWSSGASRSDMANCVGYFST